MSDKPRIVLGADDFEDQPADPVATSYPKGAAAEPQLPAVSSAPRVPVGAPPGQSRPQSVWLYDARTGPLIAAIAAMFAAWALTEILGLPGLGDGNLDLTQEDVNVNQGLLTMGQATIFVALMSAWDQLLAKAWETAAREAVRAALPMLAVGFVVGYLSNRFYASLLSDDSPSTAAYYVARALSWAMFGAAFGGVLGLARRSRQLAINGLLGGTIGGIAGGVIFEFLGSNLEWSNGALRLAGLLTLAVSIALAIRLVESVRREAWLSVVAGGMTGKEFILYHDTTRIGSSPKCEIFIVKDPAVSEIHAQIVTSGNLRTLTASPGASVAVNGAQISQRQLRNGDQIQIGNTAVAYAERAV